MINCTVIITTYNSSKTIESAILSVASQMLLLQILIVDDQSHDFVDLKNLIMNYQVQGLDIKLIENVNKGNANVSRNIGIQNAKYDYVAFLDADDTWEPNHLASAIDSMQKMNADLCFSKVQFVKDGIPQVGAQPIFNGDVAEYIFSNGIAVTSSIVSKRSALIQCMFDEKQLKHQDWEFLLRFEKQFKVCQSKYVGLNYTLSTGSNMSSNTNPAATVRFLNNTLPLKYHKKMLLTQLYLIIQKRDFDAFNKLKYELNTNYQFNQSNLGIRTRIYLNLFNKGFIFFSNTLYKIININIRIIKKLIGHD